MNTKKLTTLLLAVVLVLSLAACGAKGGDHMDGMDNEPKNAEEAAAMHKELTAQEAAILAENTALWEKVFMAADKDMDTMPDGGSKDNKTDSGSTGNKTDDSSLPKFPAFEGKDLDGNTVKSSDLFSGKAVTVVNFWFTTCGPCVGELGDLDALNKELSGKGGALIGINAFTLDGNEAAISEAKDVLTQSGATYQNVYFDSGSEAGKFVESIYAYPTTYVVNRSGRIVGDPIVGAITSKAQSDALQAQIDKALAADMG